MPALDTAIVVLSFVGVAVFAAAGALTASRKEMDPVGFILIGALTAFGGGTVRDVLLGAPVFWLRMPELVALAAGSALLVFFTAHLAERRFVWLLWVDAVGLGIFAVLGAEAALRGGASPWAAILMGIVTATFGGVIRDVVCGEIPLILRKEIYATAAALGAGVFMALHALGVERVVALGIGAAVGFALRAAAILRGWSLPTYRARPGRDYPKK